MLKEKESQVSVPVTKIESVTAYKPESLNRKLIAVKTVNDAMKIARDYPSSFPSLAKIRMHYGSEETERIIKLYMIELSELVNVKRELSEKQIDTIAMEVVNRHYALTMADIHVIFKKAINGEFGDFYESLDVPKVLKWFDQYFDERCEIGAQETVAQQFNAGGDPRASFLAKREFDKLESKLNLNKK